MLHEIPNRRDRPAVPGASDTACFHGDGALLLLSAMRKICGRGSVEDAEGREVSKAELERAASEERRVANRRL